LNPEIDIPRRYKIKETHVKEALVNMKLPVNFINDKRISGGCSSRRPDFLVDLVLFTLIIECDENSHNRYDTTCEIAKLNDTFTDLADRPIVLIRFNPDFFQSKSCFDKEGRLIKKEWIKRIIVLEKTIKKWLKRSNEDYIPKDLVTIEKLFFHI
jgi:hypothetical protein